MNALEARCIVGLLASIRFILTAITLTQIYEAIVAFISIDVIDLLRW